MQSEIKKISNEAIADFVDLPYNLFKDDKNWVGELKKDTTRLLSISHPFWLHAERELFVAYREGQPVGRIAAIINRAHNSFHGENCGFFGFFDCENNAETAKKLFSAAEQYLRNKGMDKAIGPVNPSTNETCGVLIDSFDIPPMIMMPYNPPYYTELIESAGYQKAKDLYAYKLAVKDGLPERYEKLLRRIQQSNSLLTIQKANLSDIRSEIIKVKDIYNNAWEKNWGFVPMTDAEFEDLASSVKDILKPDYLYFANTEGETVGFVLLLPNLNHALKAVNGKLTIFNFLKFVYLMKYKVFSGRLLTLGVKKEFRNKGIELLLIKQAIESAAANNWEYGEMSWTLEDNAKINKTIESIGGEKYRTYRLYGKTL